MNAEQKAEALRLADALDKCISNAELSVLGNDAADLLRTLAAEPQIAPEQLSEAEQAQANVTKDIPTDLVWAGCDKGMVPRGTPVDAQPVAWIGPYANAWEALNELRKSIAEIIGANQDTWPSHGNAPLAIAACCAIGQTASSGQPGVS